MENQINKIESRILIGFACIYVGTLFINLIMAIFGMAELAIWHWPWCAGVITLSGASLSTRQRCQIAIKYRHITKASKQVTRKVAKSLLCTLRSLRSLPALFIKSYKAFIAEEAK